MISDKQTVVVEQGGSRGFSVELNSRCAIRSASLGDVEKGVFIEGRLGSLMKASFRDGVVLEVEGTEGILRVDLSPGELHGQQVKQGVEVDSK